MLQLAVARQSARGELLLMRKWHRLNVACPEEETPRRTPSCGAPKPCVSVRDSARRTNPEVDVVREGLWRRPAADPFVERTANNVRDARLERVDGTAKRNKSS